MEEISYKEKIEKFLEDERYYSLLIKGKWGVGKTYLWKEIQDKSFQQPEKNIIYISLFGKESYKEVLEEIVIKSCNTKACNTIETFSELFGGLKIVGDISIGTILTLINKFFKQTVDFTNIIICFDDIERKSHNFRMKDFLGLVYQLKEDKCKVVIISNIDELPNYEKKIFESYEDKSIDLIIEIESKEEVISKILKEKLKDKYYEKLFPENVNKIENLRNLNKIIEAFKFFSKKLNFENELKERKEVGDLFTYVFNLIVTKINDKNSKNSKLPLTVEADAFPYKDKKEKHILEQSQWIINTMIDSYIQNSNSYISPSIIKNFKQECIKNYYYYTLIKELKEKFYIKDYSNNSKQEIQKILNEIETKRYTRGFVDDLFRDYDFYVFDFLAMIGVLNLDDNVITTIKKEIIGRVIYTHDKILVNLICNDNKELKKYTEELLAKINADKKPKTTQPHRKQTYKERLLAANNYHEFKNIITSGNEYLKNKDLDFIKDNEYVLQYVRFLSNDNEFRNNYPGLHEKLCSF